MCIVKYVRMEERVPMTISYTLNQKMQWWNGMFLESVQM